jgi:uncharacterized protein (DUF1501 family)
LQLFNSSVGTDHGWGGNYFLLGGEVRGGRMLGKYPDRLTEEDSDVTIGRGRILPTTPWEAVWSGLAQWWDIPEEDIRDEILPRMKYWPREDMFNRSHVFH